MSETLVIPWADILSDNDRMMPIKMGKFARLAMTTEYRHAKERAAEGCRAQWGNRPLFAGQVEIHAVLHFPNLVRRDPGNYRKLITDALSGVVYGDDSQLMREIWECGGIDRVYPRVEIRLRAVGVEQLGAF